MERECGDRNPVLKRANEGRLDDRAVKRQYRKVIARDSSQIIAGDLHLHTGAEQDQEHECHQAFKTSTYELYKDRNPQRVDGTCQWVLGHPSFQQWRRNKQNDLLWITADPGCGKSVLARSLVELDLYNGQEAIVCYFFFKDNEQQDNLAVALCALLHQLFTCQPNLIRYAIPAWRKNGSYLQRETSDLWRILRESAINCTTPIICILDALDECRDDDRRQLIPLLCDIVSPLTEARSEGCLKFLVTSRPYDNVGRWFEQTTVKWPHIRLRGEDKNEQIHEEINLVIDKRVQDLGHEFALSPNIQERLRQQLLSMRNRTYLWLYLTIEEIREAYLNSPYPESVTIDHLPSSVEEAYERLLGKIDKKQKPLARRLLIIIVGARRPLKVGEMVQALGAAETQQHGTDSLFLPDEQHLRRRIREWCGLFIFIQHSKLFLIHQTAKEFLLRDDSTTYFGTNLWRGSLAPLEVETEMAKLCTTYLFFARSDIKRRLETDFMLQRFDPELQESDVSRKDDQLTFFKYCAEHWPLYLQDQMVADDPQLLDRVLALYDLEGDLFNAWFRVRCQNLQSSTEYSESRLSQHIMALNGHRFVLEYLHKKVQLDLDARDHMDNTALCWAAEQGHLNVVIWLLDQDIDINAQGSYGSALILASENGQLKVVQKLLEHGADINAGGGFHGGALQTASCRGYTEIVQMLLEHGADVNAKKDDSESALYWASLRGHEEMVQMLLDADVDVNAPRGRSGDALRAASFSGRKEVVQMLLERGADINDLGDNDENALHTASACGHKEVVQLLLENGADVDAPGQLGTTALQYAAHCSCKEMVELLLKYGADVNAQGGFYGNAMEALSLGHKAASRQLFDNNTKAFGAMPGFEESVRAESVNYEAVAQILHEHGAIANSWEN